MTRTGPRILVLWSAPRSRSTAFLRMMAERGDFTVLHEPFSHVADFGRTTVDGTEVTDERQLIESIRAASAARPVFFKDTTDFHYPGLLADTAFLRDATHTFIVRDPAEAIASHYALNSELQLEEIGFEWLVEIYDRVAKASGQAPVVLGSEDLVDRPEETVRAYCAAVGIPYIAEALSWRAEMRPEWQGTSRWHELTAGTDRFGVTSSRYEHTVENNPLLARFHAYHLPYYRRLHERRLTGRQR